MSQHIFPISGYGLTYYELCELIDYTKFGFNSKEELEGMDTSEFLLSLESHINHEVIDGYGDDEGYYIYIPDNKPYEKGSFSSLEEINNHFWKCFEKYVKKEVSKEKFISKLGDIYDVAYC